MIKKLKSKIFMIIMASLSILIVSMITVFGIINYTNTLRSATIMMDRVSEFEFNRKRPQDLANENGIEFQKLEGVYTVEIQNSKIIANNENSSELEE